MTHLPASLKVLDLSGTPVTGNGLTRLDGLTDLIANRTQVSDASIGDLGQLPKLIRLELVGCAKVTSAGLTDLQKARRNLFIYGSSSARP